MTAVNRACLRDTRQLLSTERHPNALVNREKWHFGTQGCITQKLPVAFSSSLSGALSRRASAAQFCAASPPEPAKSTAGHGAATYTQLTRSSLHCTKHVLHIPMQDYRYLDLYYSDRLHKKMRLSPVDSLAG